MLATTLIIVTLLTVGLVASIVRTESVERVAIKSLIVFASIGTLITMCTPESTPRIVVGVTCFAAAIILAQNCGFSAMVDIFEARDAEPNEFSKIAVKIGRKREFFDYGQASDLWYMSTAVSITLVFGIVVARFASMFAQDLGSGTPYFVYAVSLLMTMWHIISSKSHLKYRSVIKTTTLTTLTTGLIWGAFELVQYLSGATAS